MKYALLDENDFVINIVISEMEPDGSSVALADEKVSIGYQYVSGDFVDPIAKDWEYVRCVQADFIGKVTWRIERYETQQSLGVGTSETAQKYTELLQYCEDVRQCDQSNYNSPQEAIDALHLLASP